MATMTGGTTLNINYLGMGTHGDFIVIKDGCTLLIDSTPVYIPELIHFVDGTILIDGANATAPITFAVTANISGGTKSYMTCTEGWWTLGTTLGTPNQPINFNDYFYKTVTGGSQVADVSHHVPGLRVEDGRKITFSGGTTTVGTYPYQWNWLSETYRPDSIFGAIQSFGTVTGDPTQGTFDLNYTSGTITVGSLIEIRKVIDKQGPLYGVSWQGTCTANNKCPELYTNWVNCAGSAVAAEGTSWLWNHGTGVLDRVFVQGPRQTIGTFGNGITGMLPTPGCKIQVPKVKLLVNPGITTPTFLTMIRTGKSSVYNSITDVPWRGALSSDKINFDLRGLLYSQGDLFYTPHYVESLTLQSIYTTLLTIPLRPAIINSIEKIVGALSNRGNIKTTGITKNLTISELLVHKMETGTVNFAISEGLKILNSFFIGNDRLTTMDHNISADISLGGYMDNITTRGSLQFARLIDWTLTNIRVVKTLAAYASQRVIRTTFHGGDVLITNIEHLYQDITSKLYLYTNNSGGNIKTLIFKAIGNPTYSRNPQVAEGFTSWSSPVLISNEYTIVRCFIRNHSSSANAFSDINTYGANINVSDSIMGTAMFVRVPVTNRQTIRKVRQGIITTNYRPFDFRFTDLNIEDSWADTYHKIDNSLGFIGCYALGDYTIGSGNFDSVKKRLYPNSQIQYEMNYFATGHTSFSGSTILYGYLNTTTARGAQQWSGATPTVDFQYDTSGKGGTGFNGTWQNALTQTNWIGLSLDPSKGVKLKYRITNTSTGAILDNIGGVLAETVGAADAYVNYLTPIDQTVTTITLRNMVVGSRYWIYNATTSTLITSGVASSSVASTTQDNMPNGTQLLIRVRYASDTVKYIPFETSSVTSNLLADVWVSQTIDTIAI